MEILPGMIGKTGDDLYVVLARWDETWSLHHPNDRMTYELFSDALERSCVSDPDEIIL